MKNIIVGVTLPYEAQGDAEVLALLERYGKELKRMLPRKGQGHKTDQKRRQEPPGGEPPHLLRSGGQVRDHLGHILRPPPPPGLLEPPQGLVAPDIRDREYGAYCDRPGHIVRYAWSTGLFNLLLWLTLDHVWLCMGVCLLGHASSSTSTSAMMTWAGRRARLAVVPTPTRALTIRRASLGS